MQERVYDLIFIARPATPEEEIKKVIASIEQVCAEKGAKIEKTEHWGTRKLAYKVMKHREGIYVYQQIRTTHVDLTQEIERRLGVLDSIIKYQTVRLDEALKLQKKLTHKREIRAARRPRRAGCGCAVSPGAVRADPRHRPLRRRKLHQRLLRCPLREREFELCGIAFSRALDKKYWLQKLRCKCPELHGKGRKVMSEEQKPVQAAAPAAPREHREGGGGGGGRREGGPRRRWRRSP